MVEMVNLGVIGEGYGVLYLEICRRQLALLCSALSFFIEKPFFSGIINCGTSEYLWYSYSVATSRKRNLGSYEVLGKN
jgi:hypothetical protein